MEKNDELMTVAEVAELLQVSEQTVYRWGWSNQVPGKVKAGRKVLYRRSAITAWLEQGGMAEAG